MGKRLTQNPKLEALVRRLHLRKTFVVLACGPPHGLEESRFGACPAALATIASTLIAPKTYENMRLPGTSHRDAFTHGLRFGHTRLMELHRAGLFAGAACCNVLWPGRAIERMHGVVGSPAKAAPLQTADFEASGLTTPSHFNGGTTRTRRSFQLRFLRSSSEMLLYFGFQKPHRIAKFVHSVHSIFD
jgi:hypothetical protein